MIDDIVRSTCSLWRFLECCPCVSVLTLGSGCSRKINVTQTLREKQSELLGMIFYRYPDWSLLIRNLYWYLRQFRSFDSVKIRKQYRRIAAEKKRLQSEGVDAELIRLLCRHMVNLKKKKAEERFWNAHLESIQKPLFNLPQNNSTI